MKKTKLSLVALTSFVLLLSACGGKAESSSASSSINSQPSIAESSEPAPSSLTPDPVSSSSTPAPSSSSEVKSSSSSTSVAQNFNVTAASNMYVTIEITGGTSHKEGTQVSFKVTLKNANVKLDSVKAIYGQNKELTLTNAGDTYTFTMPAGDVEIKVTAHEEQAKYTIGLPSDANVEVKIEGGVTSCVAGTNVIFTVTSKDAEKEIADVKVNKADGNPVGLNKGDDGRYSFQMPEANVNISVTLANKKYSYSLSNDGNVDFAIVGTANRFEAGEKVTFVASAKTGYSLQAVTVKGASGANVSVTKGSENYSFAMPKENVVISFDVAQLYTVTTNAGANTTITVNNAKDYYVEGESVSFAVVYADGYECDAVQVKNGSATVSASLNASTGVYTFTMPKGNVVINATAKSISSGSSEDPFPNAIAFEGSWNYYDGYYDYLMRMRVRFNGNGTLSYCITWEDNSYDEWTRPNTGFTTIQPQMRGGIPSTMSGMQGTHKDDDTDKEYTYDAAKDSVTANLAYNMSTKDMEFKIIRSGSNITAIKPVENFTSGFHACGGVTLYKI